MRRINSNAAAVLAIAAAMTLAGCSGDRSDLEQWVQQTLARPPAPVDPIPSVLTPEPVVYSAYDLRDPFARPQAASADTGTAADGPRPDPDRRREFLERFPLDALAMVGTIEVDAQVYGLVADVEGVIHRVQQGNYMGQNHGRILRISPVAIELVELVPDGAEGWMEREARVALPEPGQQG
ncbi:MAG: fimbrial protein [Gammaproteobacteria bacterium HGW-Gammaproteobacteria-8]|nr:MAG: fimbrial protein [Gammaproteobacteria bacterium HGW-Gammaproteobacteria-8]